MMLRKPEGYLDACLSTSGIAPKVMGPLFLGVIALAILCAPSSFADQNTPRDRGPRWAPLAASFAAYRTRPGHLLFRLFCVLARQAGPDRRTLRIPPRTQRYKPP